MRQPSRREKIASLLEKAGEVTIADLARRLSVSEMTVRRDLDALAEEDRAIRTHGGACALRGHAGLTVVTTSLPIGADAPIIRRPRRIPVHATTPDLCYNAPITYRG